MSEKNFRFPETTRSLKYEWLLLFPWLFYSPSEDASYCLSCVLFSHDFPTKTSRVKNLYLQLFKAWPSAVSYFRAHCEAKRRKLILHMNLLKAFIFQHVLNLKLFFSKLKFQVMKFICYVTENINMRLNKTVKY